MISYDDFATALSYVIDVMYIVLLLIVVRRAVRSEGRMSPNYRETVSSHARRVEGPLLLVLALGALGVTVTASAISDPEYVNTALLFIGAVRGGLAIFGIYLLAYYWTVRESWLR